MRNWFVIAILAVSQFVMILDSTVMNVSISEVAADLDTTITGMQAAITFYTLTMAAFMLTGGKFGDLWGRTRAFKIGSIIYGLGSLITAISPNLPTLLVGWSLIEGLGAVLVIPAIAALAAVNYTGKARVTAFSILGAVTGLAAAVGPLIGGLVTTYLSWRYVFAAETVVMIGVLLVSGRISDEARDRQTRIDPLSVVLSAGGMALVVLGVLQSKTWGWLAPLNPPEIGDTTIAPLGVSPVAYLILIGAVILWIFVNRQQALSRTGRQPLLNVRLLRIGALRSGLAGFLVQYFAIAALFFVVPVYLQTMLGKDAMQTGLKILPLSAGLVVFSVLGSWLTARRSTRFIARVGQLTMAVGILLTLGAVEPALRGALFAVGMFVVGAGFGLLASQLGNANMSAVEERDTSEVGGLQGTFQNLGSSFGTAIVGSVFILLLGSGFTTSVQDAQTLSPSQKQQITTSLNETGVPIISEADAQALVARAGGSDDAAAEVGDLYADSQIQALKQALFIVFALTVLSLLASRRLPDRIAGEDTADDRSD
ncbi:MFS transporter [Gordonia bronchialis]|uniref:MFS transporter n=1 Tax=Gordonia bronchialis TaxID=2054 RepID=UPI00242F5D90|nr:MFS transporter [Gordonia bronchialis]